MWRVQSLPAWPGEGWEPSSVLHGHLSGEQRGGGVAGGRGWLARWCGQPCVPWSSLRLQGDGEKSPTRTGGTEQSGEPWGGQWGLAPGVAGDLSPHRERRQGA